MRKFEDPDSKVRKACFCGYTESDLKYKGLTFWRVNFAVVAALVRTAHQDCWSFSCRNLVLFGLTLMISSRPPIPLC